ncbi:TauD/TfdA family dioxygenase [Actinomadura viridis]|uniref:TauD/TfdA family dioxygenase n=1 Tax=Actinomadura viridis TaxID=58110 RepID=UPI00368A3CAD
MSAMPHHTLPAVQARDLFDACATGGAGPRDGYGAYWDRCRAIASGRAGAPLRRWLEPVRAYGLGLLSGVRLDEPLPATPHERGAGPSLPVADTVIGAVAASLGVLFTIDGKADPRHVHDVYFIPEDAATQLGTGCSRLEWHVEDGCHPTRPDWVILLCLRGGPDVVTSVARCADMRFSRQERELLEGTPVRLRLDDSFQGAGDQEFGVPTLSTTRQGLEIIYDPAYTVRDAMTDRIVSLVSREAAEVRHDVVLRAGDVLVFNNRRAIHARTGFDPSQGSGDRWVKRALVLADPARARWRSPGVVHA